MIKGFSRIGGSVKIHKKLIVLYIYNTVISIPALCFWIPKFLTFCSSLILNVCTEDPGQFEWEAEFTNPTLQLGQNQTVESILRFYFIIDN
jgi:hypothetical protein